MLRLEVLPDVDVGDLAATVEMLSQRRFISTVVNILDEHAPFVTIFVCFALAEFVIALLALLELTFFAFFLIYRKSVRRVNQMFVNADRESPSYTR